MVRWFKCVVFLVFSISMIACKQQAAPDQADSIPVIHDFDSFYKLFHSDSAFQLSRILFPLEGLPEQTDTISLNESYYWLKENWILHRKFNENDSLFDRQFQIVDSTLLRETIYHKLSDYKMERRYSWMTDGWYLIYYAPMRQPSRIQIN